MTAPPGAPIETSEDPDHVSGEPGAAAFGLLSGAQALADQLRTEVRTEVAALRSEDTPGAGDAEPTPENATPHLSLATTATTGTT